MDGQTGRSTASFEFTYDGYRAFLDELRDAGLDFRTFSEGVAAGDVLLRHDVDLSVEKALTVARIEAERGIKATYCVLLTSALYNPLDRRRRGQLHAIEAMGHEVALHFSTHEYWNAADPPGEAALAARVADEREVLGTVLPEPPETVAFHIPPDWVLDRSFEGFTSTYAPAYFGDIDYVADSGQRWRETPPAVAESPTSTQVLTHPGLWGEDDGGFENRVDHGISEACAYADQKASREFLQEGDSR